MKNGDVRWVDVVVLAAIRLEFDAVLQVDAGAAPGSAWERATGPSGLPVAYRSFVVAQGRPLRVAVALAPDMGATAAVNTLLPLVEALAPRCIAMCGVCAGRRGKVELGDVVAADRLYYHDAGKQRPGEVQQDLTTYKLRDDWKTALDGMDAVARFRDEPWFRARPMTAEWRLARALAALRDGAAEPWKAVDSSPGAEEAWPQIVAALRQRGLLATSSRALKPAGKRWLEQLEFEHRGALPDLSPAGELQPFRLHVSPIGSGARVIEDEQVWTFVSQAMRKTLGLEMEAAAVAELAHRQRQHALDWVVMKGVMDFADHGRDDHFKDFAARASAECLLWFLRDHVATETMAGFDDLLGPGTLRLPDRVPAPSLLLNAHYAVVPWHEAGRSETLEQLDAWADDRSRPVAVQLVHAEGGTGKTRLAIEWVRRRRARYDTVGFLAPAPDARWLERLCGLGAPVIAIVDYAESRADLIALLQRVAALAASADPHPSVHVLLLARNDGDWWKALPQRDPAIGALAPRAPIKLAPLATTAIDREAVFAEAARAFAARRGQAQVPASGVPIALDDARFERTLYLHMAALAAVEGIPAFDAGSLMDEVLAHEERFWLRTASDRAGAAIDLPLARQLVVAATLRGELASWDEACAACERLARRPRGRDDDALVALLHDIYDREDRARYLPGLEPDLLGEAMVLRVAAPPPGVGPPAGTHWIERVIRDDDDPRAVTMAFTVLGRASAANPAAVTAWIAALLGRDLASRAVLALRAAKAVGLRTAASTLGDALADALERDGSLAIADALADEQIPHPTITLRRVAAWQSGVQLAHAPTGNDELSLALRGTLLFEHGYRCGDLGDLAAALAADRAAVDVFRALAAHDPELHNTALAGSLNNLGKRLLALGDHAAARAATAEAVALYRELAALSPGVFQRDLAASLSNLGVELDELGEREAALTASREAVALRRELAARDPATFEPDLAASLGNLGTLLAARGDAAAGFAATQEALALFRGLAARRPDAFQLDVASALNNLSNAWKQLGNPDKALAAAQEAVAVHRALAAARPDAHRAGLATNLGKLALKLHALGRRDAALTTAEEAVALCRSVADAADAADPSDAAQVELARSLHGLGIVRVDLGLPKQALTATREAIELYRTLAVRRPAAHDLDLVHSLHVLCGELEDLGRTEDALAAIHEAVALSRTLAARDPAMFQPLLAQHLHNLNAVQNAAGDLAGAIATKRESVELYRALAARDAAAFEPELASGLHILGGLLHQHDQGDASIDTTREAVAVYRALAARDRKAFAAKLVNCLKLLGSMLDSLGQLDAAVAATQDAVDCCRSLVATNPAVFQPELASSLADLGDRLQALDRNQPAVTATREAVALYRRLAARDPAFQNALDDAEDALDDLLDEAE